MTLNKFKRFQETQNKICYIHSTRHKTNFYQRKRASYRIYTIDTEKNNNCLQLITTKKLVKIALQSLSRFVGCRHGYMTDPRP